MSFLLCFIFIVPPRLRTPIGTRGCSILGLSDAYIAELIITTRKCLADESTANNLRFQQLGLGCLAYFACEKRGLTSFYSPLKSKLNQIRRRSVGLACEHSMLLSRLKSKRGSLKTSSTASGLRCHSSSIINILHHVIETFGLETAILEEVRYGYINNSLFIYHTIIVVFNYICIACSICCTYF